MEKILAINSGSSSLKFKLFEMPEEKEIASGLIERIGISGSHIKIKYGNNRVYEHNLKIKNHKIAVDELMNLFSELKIIKNYQEISGVGHRVVAGGEYFNKSCIINEDVIKKIKELGDMAPLHNPANLMGIEAFRKILPHAVSVAVFDTSFHQTMPEENFIYATPYEWYEKYHVRRYGAHGTSHRYVANIAADLMGKPLKDLKLITCHLGAGASICAVKNGKSYDTSMGFTPLTGLIMATRSGDIDISLIAYVMDKLKIHSISEMIYILNKESGFLGVSGESPDMRDIEAIAHTNHRAELAIKIFYKDVIKYIGQYMFEMEGLDGIVFTAGIGENSEIVRRDIVNKLSFLGVSLDEDANNRRGKSEIISDKKSKITVMKVYTNEELMIVKDVMELM